MFDIITFGSATWDIFLTPESYSACGGAAASWQIAKNKKFVTGKGVCFNLGSKVDVESICLSSGGGGTNTAAAFSKQSFRVAYCATVGDDISGREIIEELKKLGVDVSLVLKTKLKLMIITGLTLVIVGYLMDPITPIIKRISTSSFVIVSGKSLCS